MMGGRGSASSGAAKQYAAAYAKPKELVMPKLIGSEKQKKWANDIIRDPYMTLSGNSDAALKTARRYIDIGAGKQLDPASMRRAEVFAAARDTYAESIEKLQSAHPEGIKASWIIEHKGQFAGNAQKALDIEFQKRKKSRADYANDTGYRLQR